MHLLAAACTSPSRGPLSIPGGPAAALSAEDEKAGDGADSSILSRVWELEPEHESGFLGFSAYKDTYVLPVKWSARVNRRPTSPGGRGNNVPMGFELPYRQTEAMFQLSFKTRVWKDAVVDWADLWFGYTQQSYWQVYTSGGFGPRSQSEFSRPFRETNYQPELLLAMATDVEVPLVGLRLRLLAPGIEHQSNGRAEPLSRSWNRVYLLAAMEREDFVLMLKPWLRIHESRPNDDNPRIERFLGRGQVEAYQRFGESTSLHLRLRTTYRIEPSWGSAQLTWRYRFPRGWTLLVQAFHGYGESLVDYNFRNTTFGIGLSVGSPY